MRKLSDFLTGNMCKSREMICNINHFVASCRLYVYAHNNKKSFELRRIIYVAQQPASVIYCVSCQHVIWWVCGCACVCVQSNVAVLWYDLGLFAELVHLLNLCLLSVMKSTLLFMSISLGIVAELGQ